MKRCVSGVLVKDNKILLGKRSARRKFYPNVWDLIGGHCKNSETLEETLLRELQEEIGVTPIKYKHISVLSEPEPEVHGDYEYHVYLVTDWLGTPKNLSPNEHSELRWVELSDALQLKLAHPKYPTLFRDVIKFFEST